MNNASRESIAQALLAVLSKPQVFQADADGSAVLINISDFQFQGLYFGMAITGPGVPDGTVIVGIDTTILGTITLSNSVTSGVQVSFTGQTFKTTSRKFQLWSEVPNEERPFLCFLDKPEVHKHNGIGQPPTVYLDFLIFIYTFSGVSDSKDGPPPISTLNPILDALINIALAPPLMSLRQTLGNDHNGNPYCADCYVEGNVHKNGGDLGGQGIALVPIRIMIPW